MGNEKRTMRCRCGVFARGGLGGGEQSGETEEDIRPLYGLLANRQRLAPLQQGRRAQRNSPRQRESHGARGGHVRNYDLITYGANLSPAESADLEIRRALRIGIDGFAVDAWAGDNNARNTLDALFKTAEEKNYPFELTICIDPTCGGNLVASVKELLRKHGKSPKLARRDGKPLVFGYQSVWPCAECLAKKMPGKTDKEFQRLRTSPEGWELMGQAFDDATKQLGQPIYWHVCLNAFFYGVDGSLLTKDSYAQAAGILAKHVQAVGAFQSVGGDQDALCAKAVKAAGAEWASPLGMFQKENIPYELYGGKGLDWMIGNWEAVRKEDPRLLQIVTWNDYGENSNIAPAYNTRYALYDLNGYFIKWWKTGAPPKPDHDSVYLISRKYPPGVKVFPFKQGPYLDGALEVVTILTSPATVRLPGRNAEYQAPAGFYRKQFPVTAGPVIAELVRGGAVVLTLEHPEPITDRPFREDNAMTCYSTEYQRHWKADFGDTKPFIWSEYGDVDHDGLPNWFEMYWFGKFGDMSTAAAADPKTIAPSGKTLLQEYLDQTDPTKKPIPYAELPKTNLLAWYRADQGVVADDKGRISAWRDQSGNHLDLAAPQEQFKPHLVENAWHGLPVVQFDGVQNSLLCKIPEGNRKSITVIAAYSARAEDQINRIQEGHGNRLVSIRTTTKEDYIGGVSMIVDSIGWWKGDVAVATRKFDAGEQPTFLGLGYMVGTNQDYRGWNFKGKAAEILVYSPALSDADAQKVASILKNRYRL